MDLNGLPQNIADQLTADIERLQAKAQRLSIQAETDRIMDLLPDNATLPIGYNGFWLDRAKAGWTAFKIVNQNGIEQLVPDFRVNGNKITLKSAWPIFVRWVDQTVNQSVVLSDAKAIPSPF